MTKRLFDYTSKIPPDGIKIYNNGIIVVAYGSLYSDEDYTIEELYEIIKNNPMEYKEVKEKRLLEMLGWKPKEKKVENKQEKGTIRKSLAGTNRKYVSAAIYKDGRVRTTFGFLPKLSMKTKETVHAQVTVEFVPGNLCKLKYQTDSSIFPKTTDYGSKLEVVYEFDKLTKNQKKTILGIQEVI